MVHKHQFSNFYLLQLLERAGVSFIHAFAYENDFRLRYLRCKKRPRAGYEGLWKLWKGLQELLLLRKRGVLQKLLLFKKRRILLEVQLLLLKKRRILLELQLWLLRNRRGLLELKLLLLKK